MEYPLHTAPVILKQYLGSVLDLQLYFVDSHQSAFSKKNMLVYTHLKFTWNSTSKSGTRKTTKMFPMKNVIMITNTTNTSALNRKMDALNVLLDVGLLMVTIYLFNCCKWLPRSPCSIQLLHSRSQSSAGHCCINTEPFSLVLLC